MKIKYLVSVSGDTVVKAGDEAEVSEDIALRLIFANIAKATTKKAQDAALKKIEKSKEEALKKERELEAALQRDELLREKKTLLARVEEIDNILNLEEVEEIEPVVRDVEEIEPVVRDVEVSGD